MKYKDRIPIIVEIIKCNKTIIGLDKHKFLVPYDLTLAQFLCVIRKRINLNSEQSLFIFFNNRLPMSTDIIQDLYNKYKDEDGFLYAVISLENTFG